MRKKAVATAIAGALILGIAPALSQEEKAKEKITLPGNPIRDVCALASSLGKGTESIIDQLEHMAAAWREADRAKLGPIMTPEVGKFTMEPGVVYLIADLAPFTKEYLIVSAARKQGQSVYFRVIYETGPSGYYFKNVNFNSNFYEILNGGLFQSPARLECS